MIDDKNKAVNESAFDLEIEDEPDTDEIMREAMEAVKSHKDEDGENLDPVGDAAEDPVDGENAEAHVEVLDGDEDGGADTSSSEGSAVSDGSKEVPLKVQLEEAQERKIRALADYENFRRRVDRERRDFARYAAEKALTEFLPILDNLSRALESKGDVDDLKSGVEMIQSQVVEVMTRLHVLAVPSVGERFDPSVHEAVAKEEDCDVEQPTILEEYQTGYTLHDRLLRPSMVRVAMPRDRISEEESDTETSTGEAQ